MQVNEALPTDILLAEDDQDDVHIFEIALEQIPLRIILRHAKDGDKLFILLKELIPDYLFIDIHMPCKDGITCITEIRRDKRYDQMPVIMYSSFDSGRHIEETYRNGANFYITKSGSITDLVASLKKIFSFDWKTHMVYPTIDQFRLS